MSVSLRMQRHGQKKRPFYRIVAAQTSAPRDGRYLEVVGTYNPMINPAITTIKEDRIKHWVAVGAKPSQLVRSIIKKEIPGLVEAKEGRQRDKIKARRKPRRDAVTKKGKK